MKNREIDRILWLNVGDDCSQITSTARQVHGYHKLARGVQFTTAINLYHTCVTSLYLLGYISRYKRAVHTPVRPSTSFTTMNDVCIISQFNSTAWYGDVIKTYIAKF
uniref:ORF16 n=1 Tax=Malaco herpesvirus 1 TaxID=3031797 RepID=A0AA48P833_9VIRU|nr:TPA_asm: ORF16 [Malaco herpesvirus 1]